MTRLKSLSLAAALLLAAVPTFAKNDNLSLVPANAVTVGVVKISDLRTSPLSGMLFEQTDKMSGNGDAEKFLADAGLDVTKDVDVLVVSTTPRTNLGTEADVLVTAEGRFNVERLSNALVSRGAVKKGNYFITPEEKGERGAVAFPSSRLAVMGNERAVASALAALANGGTNFRSASGLAGDLARIDGNATAWAIVDVTRAQRLAGGGHTPTGQDQSSQALAAAMKSVSTIAVWATDTGDSLKLGAFGLTSDEETRQLLEDTLKGALSAMRLAVKDKAPELVSVLRRFDVDHTSDAVTVSGSIPATTLRDLMAKKRAAK